MASSTAFLKSQDLKISGEKLREVVISAEPYTDVRVSLIDSYVVINFCKWTVGCFWLQVLAAIAGRTHFI